MPETQAETLPQLLLEKAARYPKRVALREKEYGIWNEVTWAGYAAQVESFALGLAALGFRRGDPRGETDSTRTGDKVCIIGDNRPEWAYAALATQSLGGVVVGIYQDSSPGDVQYLAELVEARYVVVEDQEQADKLLEVKAQLPKVEQIIYIDPKGMRKYDDPWLLSFEQVQARGREFGQKHPGDFREQVALGRAEDVGMICTTSGTTGRPKGAMLTYRNAIEMARHYTAVDQPKFGDDIVSFLPMAWAGEQLLSFWLGLYVGLTVNFPEEPETVQENIREIGPRIFVAAPRSYENLLTTVQVKINDSTKLKRWLYNRFLPVALKLADKESNRKLILLNRQMKGSPSWLRRTLFYLQHPGYMLGDFFVYGPIKDSLGLRKVKWAYVGGAALGPDMFRFFRALGVNLKQIYGQTECAGLAVMHRDEDVRVETVGVPYPGIEIAVSPTGEILHRSTQVFAGYYNNAEATAKARDAEGWLHTGDQGLLQEDGHLVMMDRMADVMTLANGSKFAPSFIENKIKFSPYVKEAVVFGPDRPYIAALVNIDLETVGKWAESHQIAYTTYTDLSQKCQIYELIRGELARVNADPKLPAAHHIQKFVVLYKELDADDDELTRTRKVRRGVVSERYAPLIAGMYDGKDSVYIEGQVKLRDGRLLPIKTDVRVMSVEERGEPALQEARR